MLWTAARRFQPLSKCTASGADRTSWRRRRDVLSAPPLTPDRCSRRACPPQPGFADEPIEPVLAALIPRRLS